MVSGPRGGDLQTHIQINVECGGRGEMEGGVRTCERKALGATCRCTASK